MRIYFIGCHSAGKTTLSRYVSSKYNLPMITEVARKVLSERELDINSLRYNLDAVDDFQKETVLRQITEEKNYTSFVSDRSFDGLAYVAQHSRQLSSILEIPELAEYIDALRQPDVILFFVRPSKATMKNDGVRETVSWDGMVQIDAMCKFMLEMWNLKYFQINMENMQERVRLVDAVLSLL